MQTSWEMARSAIASFIAGASSRPVPGEAGTKPAKGTAVELADPRLGDLEDLGDFPHRHLVLVVEADDEEFPFGQRLNGAGERVEHLALFEPLGEVLLVRVGRQFGRAGIVVVVAVKEPI